MENFTVFGSNAPTYGNSSTSFETAKEKAAAAKAAKIAAAEKAKKDAEITAARQARDMANVNAGLSKINATHGLTYDPITGSYKGGRRRRILTRRSRKTKTKRRKTRRRR